MGLRWRLLAAPWWVLSLVMGGFYALGMCAAALLISDAAPVAALIGAVVAGVVFGLVMGPLMRRQNRGTIAAMGDVSPDRYREVGRAVSRGPAPADPEVRRAALSLLDHQVRVFRRLRWAYALYPFLIALAIFNAVSSSAWWLLAAVLFAGFLVNHARVERRMPARRRLLDEPAASAPLA